MPLEQHVVDRLNTANIPLRFHETRLASVEGGDMFQRYLNEQYSGDQESRTGIHVFGNPARRAALFPLMARAMTLRGDHVFYTSMVVIRDIARSDDHPLSEVVMSCRALYVQFFCTAAEGNPYSHSDRAEIEGLLLSRTQLGHRNYFSAMDQLTNCSWWSIDFLTNIVPCMREYEV